MARLLDAAALGTVRRVDAVRRPRTELTAGLVIDVAPRATAFERLAADEGIREHGVTVCLHGPPGTAPAAAAQAVDTAGGLDPVERDHRRGHAVRRLPRRIRDRRRRPRAVPPGPVGPVPRVHPPGGRLMAAALKGFAAADAALRSCPGLSPRIGRTATRSAAAVARREIARATPKRSGDLARSVGVKGVGGDDSPGATVGYNVGDAPLRVDYAVPFVRGARGAKPNPIPEGRREGRRPGDDRRRRASRRPGRRGGPPVSSAPPWPNDWPTRPA